MRKKTKKKRKIKTKPKTHPPKKTTQFCPKNKEYKELKVILEE